MVITVTTAASASSANLPLVSYRHKQCHNIIMFNENTGEAHMLHVWDAAYEGLSQEQKEEARLFTGQEGKKFAVRIKGSRSYITDDFVGDALERKSVAESYLEGLGVHFLPEITVKSDDAEWNVYFDPKTKQVTVSTHSGNELLYEGTLFQNQMTDVHHLFPAKKSPPSLDA